MKRRVLSFIPMFLLALPCGAKVELSKTVPVALPSAKMRTAYWAKDIDKLLPTDVTEDDDANHVMMRVGDNFIQRWLSSPEVASSPAVRVANTVQNSMKSEVNIAGDEDSPIDHKMSFQLLALQTAAKVEYKGWLNAAWNYDMRGGVSMVELSERMWRNKDLTLSHTANQTEDISSVGIRWSW